MYGHGAITAMRNYIDRMDSEIFKTQDDDGQFAYCLLKFRNNHQVIYNPYELEIVKKEEALKEPIYFTCSATHIAMVNYYIE